jgi:MFS family permease
VRQRPIVVLLTLQLIGGMIMMPQRTFFPIYLSDMGYSAVLISTLAAISQLMGLIASLIGGTLCDTLGRKWTFLAGEVGLLFGSLVFLSPQPAWVALLWTISGFGLGLHTLGGQSYLMDAVRLDSLGMLSALYNWGYTIGGAMGSPLAGLLLERWSYRTFGTAFVGLYLVTLAVNLLALPQTSTAARNKVTERKRLFGYGEIVTRPPIVMLSLLRFLPTLYWGMALILIPLLLDSAGASKPTVALYATSSQVIAALAQMVTGWAADRLGIRRPSFVVLAAFVLGILGISAAPHQVAVLAVFGTLSTAAAWSLSTLLPLWVTRVAEPLERGRILGWLHLWWNAAMIAGSMAAGPLLQKWASLPFLIAGTLNLGTIALAARFLNAEGWQVREPES